MTQEIQASGADNLLTGASLLAPAEDVGQDSTSVSLPSIFEYLEDGRFAVQLFAEGCLDCGHLRASGSEEGPPKCHHSQGNTNCPIPWMVLQFTGLRVRYKARMQKALAAGDRGRFARLMGDASAELDQADFDWLTDQFVVNPS